VVIRKGARLSQFEAAAVGEDRWGYWENKENVKGGRRQLWRVIRETFPYLILIERDGLCFVVEHL